MPLYDFRCWQGHMTEELQPMAVRTIDCGACAAHAFRVPVNRVAVRSGDVLEIDSPTTRQKFRLFREASDELAESGPAIDIWGPAKARVAAMTAAGEAPATLIDTRKELTNA